MLVVYGCGEAKEGCRKRGVSCKHDEIICIERKERWRKVGRNIEIE